MCQSEQVTRSSEQEGITRGGGRGKNDGVDDRGQSRDTSTDDGDDPGRRSSTSATIQESVVRCWDSDTDGKRSEHVEEQNTPKDTLHGLWNVLARVLGLSSSDSDHLHTSIRESSVGERGEETSESSGVTGANVFPHGSIRVLPVTEAKSVAARSTTKIDDQSEDQ